MQSQDEKSRPSRGGCQGVEKSVKKLGIKFEAEVDIYGWGGMGERSAGNEVGSGGGVGSNSFKCEAAGQLHFRASGDMQNPLLCFAWSQVVEQQVCRAP